MLVAARRAGVRAGSRRSSGERSADARAAGGGAAQGSAVSDRADGAAARGGRRARRVGDSRSAAGGDAGGHAAHRERARARLPSRRLRDVLRRRSAVARRHAALEHPDARPERSRRRQRAADAALVHRSLSERRCQPAAGVEACRAAGRAGEHGAGAAGRAACRRRSAPLPPPASGGRPRAAAAAAGGRDADPLPTRTKPIGRRSAKRSSTPCSSTAAD